MRVPFLFGLLLIGALAWRSQQVQGRTDITDDASYANMNEIQQTHAEITLDLDFEK